MRPLSMCASALLLSTLLGSAAAHGRLTKPSPRSGGNSGGSGYIEDVNSPINFNGDDEPESSRLPANDPSQHPEGQSLVCRVPNGEQDEDSVVHDVQAGDDLTMRWEFEADHPGDGGLYVTYDAGYSDTQQMRFFKIANFPQQRRNNNEDVRVSLPDWLPPGPAVLRWDWYATHNAPWTEFYANCIDVVIASSSALVPADIPSYKIETGTGSPNSYDAYNCEDCWCWDCPASDWASVGMNGPACVGGVEGNCCDLSQYSPVDFDADSGGGFGDCASEGSSGPAPVGGGGGGGGGGG
ncbi:hypothetical protein TeGR_g12387, partial [Tetraparma gracilis]